MLEDYLATRGGRPRVEYTNKSAWRVGTERQDVRDPAETLDEVYGRHTFEMSRDERARTRARDSFLRHVALNPAAPPIQDLSESAVARRLARAEGALRFHQWQRQAWLVEDAAEVFEPLGWSDAHLVWIGLDDDGCVACQPAVGAVASACAAGRGSHAVR